MGYCTPYYLMSDEVLILKVSMAFSIFFEYMYNFMDLSPYLKTLNYCSHLDNVTAIIFLSLNVTWMKEFAGSALVSLWAAQAHSAEQNLHTPTFMSCLLFIFPLSRWPVICFISRFKSVANRLRSSPAWFDTLHGH